MSHTTRIRPVPVLVAIVVIAFCGFGLWQLLSDPVADLTQETPPRSKEFVEDRTPSPPRPPEPSEAYVGSSVCADCHADIYEKYQTNPMAHSLLPVSQASPIEDFEENPGFEKALPTSRFDMTIRYFVSRDDKGNVLHHEMLRDTDGTVLYDQSVPVHYEFGSGKRGRSYVTNRDGMMFMSPITWYSGENRWDFSPGYEMQNLRFDRRILDGCVGCHSGRVAVTEQPHRYKKEPFIEPSIGCEQCHGPGQDHVALHLNGGPVAGKPDPIVNPADLEPRLRDSVCYQCHLVGEERVPRYGRTDFDFRPGDDISDIWIFFIRGTGVEKDRTTEAVSQAPQMLASACFRNSEGRLGCTSCHDAHSVPKPESRVQFYRSRCLQCHYNGDPECSMPVEMRKAETAEDSCIHCHMPRIEANDVPHTSQTDHRVLRSYDSDDSVERGSNSVLWVYGEETGRLPEAEIERARGLLTVMQAERVSKNTVLVTSAIPMLEKWFETAPDDVVVAESLGTAYWLIKDMDAAMKLWEHALKLEPDNEGVLRRLVVACHDNGKIESGVKYGRRLVELNPWNHMYFGRLAHLLGQMGAVDEGIEKALHALKLNPAAYGIHKWLAEAYAQKGDERQSEHHRRLFQKFSPRQSK